MPSGSRKRASDVSDDFIVDDEPRLKKSKPNAIKSANSVHADKSSAGVTRKVDTNGDNYWDIAKMRRVTISSFRGKTLVNIREYYEKDGQELPGKKGISLPIDQFSTLLTLLPEIESALKEGGESIPRPNYAHNSGPSSEGDDGDVGSSGEHSETRPSRKNIDATSDEDESEE
ncbi:hypothetical protein P175DRAFT_0518107 [Aspergillus ochraceoroseus IBT 24754]|uniref:Transcriptional coactivator p15 (PC4) C-terminal domain-containing protein n=3 Tax=Aspergillus subgen. Nidulantes TaxID=2720870 RepID=A0A0F8USN2_9EURO|nr:uncharacterized protein P175DRAFT_0518107 [Aspergillus ochraceoroseus IBT 24754]KKK13851.1 hypothetical protein ARAM_001548 [Aspergillus rambellii]KKK23242.1 hypothetical protein AOCH_001196 [Aspergillus ochraceoroseus]PTU18657.1 hypothetical protein P175DRAFT_0518107 [Aspergillus ochraceoroseus IBT 24754]